MFDVEIQNIESFQRFIQIHESKSNLPNTSHFPSNKSQGNYPNGAKLGAEKKYELIGTPNITRKFLQIAITVFNYASHISSSHNSK